MTLSTRLHPLTRDRRSAAAALAAVGCLTLVGCGLQPAAAYVPPAAPGSIEELDLPDGAAVTVGAKNFTEQLVLGKIAVLALTAAGFDVTDQTNIPGSTAARQSLVSGDSDMQWEYTGTAWLSYLGESEGIPDFEEQYVAVRDADAANGLTWLPPAPLNNTYAFAIRSEAVEELGGVSTLSEMAALPVEDRTMCVEPEFASRNDGFEPMLEAYGIPLGDPQGVPRDSVSTLDTGAVYSAIDDGTCNFGEIFTTDGRIQALDLTVLEDDQGFFPAYNVAAVVGTDTLEEYPGIADVFADLSEAITDEALIELNGQVDVDGREPADVAYDWMIAEGFITEP